MAEETKNTKPADEEIEKTAEPTAGEEKQPETETDVELQAGMQAGMKNETQAGVQTETENEMQTDMQNSREFICRFRFEKPVFVDEKLQVEARTERGKQIYECKREDREIVWNMRIL